MASLVDQIYQQVEGASGRSGSGAPFIQGVQLGQNQQRINLAERQLAAEMAQMPLKQTLMLQEQELNRLNIDSKLTDRQIFLDGQKKMLEYKKTLHSALSEAGVEDAQRFHAQFGVDNPEVLTNPAYQQSGKQLSDMRKQTDLDSYRTIMGEASTLRAEAAKARAELDKASLELDKTKVELRKLTEQRLKDQFEFDKQKVERTVPPDKLALFRELADSIQNDLSLIADAPKREKALRAIAEELKIGKTPSVAPTPSTTGGGFKVRVIKP